MNLEELTISELDWWSKQITLELRHRRLSAKADEQRETAKSPAIVYQQQYTRCGKERCKKCNGDQATGHGPYWYAYWSEGGRTRSKYIGKTRPGAEAQELSVAPEPAKGSAYMQQLLAILTPERQKMQDLYRKLGWTRKQLEERINAERSILGEMGVMIHVAVKSEAMGRKERYIIIEGMRHSSISLPVTEDKITTEDKEKIVRWKKGLWHLAGGLMGNNYTICGQRIPDYVTEEYKLYTDPKQVTCKKCHSHTR